MSDKDRQENFAARLQRIEARQNSEIPADSGVAPPHKEPSRFDNSPQEDVTVRNTLIWMAIAVAACVGGYYGIKAMPQDLKNTIAWITGIGPGETNDVPPTIAETDTMSDQGPVVAAPGVATATLTPTNLNAIARDIALPTDTTPIGQIIPFDRNVSCTLRKPMATETIVNIRMENGLLPAPVQAFSAAALSNQLLQNVTTVTQHGDAYDHSAQVTGTLHSVDVFLTDSSAPLYLVLQNMGPGIVWNIHAAPDVTVAHVAIVASEISGLANIAETTTFDAVLVSDFVAPHAASDENDCMIRPWRNPQADWTGAQNAAAGDTASSDQMQSYRAGYTAYNAWFTKTLGIDAGTDVISIRDAAHILHGDVPAEPIAYQTLAGQDIHLMRTDHVITGDAQTRANTVTDLHEQTLLAAVSGPIGNLNPASVTRDTQ